MHSNSWSLAWTLHDLLYKLITIVLTRSIFHFSSMKGKSKRHVWFIGNLSVLIDSNFRIQHQWKARMIYHTLWKEEIWPLNVFNRMPRPESSNPKRVCWRFVENISIKSCLTLILRQINNLSITSIMKLIEINIRVYCIFSVNLSTRFRIGDRRDTNTGIKGTVLTHWSGDKLDDILHMTFQMEFIEQKCLHVES